MEAGDTSGTIRKKHTSLVLDTHALLLDTGPEVRLESNGHLAVAGAISTGTAVGSDHAIETAALI